jgi:hypothetical protein
MDDTAQFVGSLNVARFVDRLRVEHDPAIRRSLNRLLLREWDNLGINLGQLGNVCSAKSSKVGLELQYR